jgi:hypothetical protein
MKRIGWPLIVFGLAVLTWLSVIYWVPHLSMRALVASGKCPDGDIAACKEVLSALGATGDIFGAVTSLFSGLALFAVAFTLWVDSKAHREGRKPLVIAYLDGDSVVLDEPTIGGQAGLSMTIEAKVANKTGEAALNVAVTIEIAVSGVSQLECAAHLRLPLLSGGTEDASIRVRLEGAQLQAVLGALTEDNSCVTFSVVTRYDSLENVGWTTRATYELTCRSGERRRRLNALRSGTDDFAELWQNNAAVSLDIDVRNGSWHHQMS